MGNFYEAMKESDTMDKWYKCDDCGIAPATDTYGDDSGALYYVCEECYAVIMGKLGGWDDSDTCPCCD